MFINNLLGYFCPLLICLAFCLLGVYPIVLALRHKRDAARRMGGFIVFLPIGLFVGAFILYSPSPWERIRHINAILNIKPSDVQSIVIVATPTSSKIVSSLVSEDCVITDRERISSICEGLNVAKADTFSGNYQSTWTCKLRLTLSSGVYECSVAKDWQGQCFFYPCHRGANLGRFHSDLLGQVLEFLPRVSPDA